VRRPDLFSEGTDEGGRQLGALRLLVAAIIVILIVGGFLYVKSRALVTPTDSQSLCPTKQSPTEVVAILLDPSDRLGEPQRIQLQSALDRVANAVQRFGLVEVYRIGTSASSVPQPVLHLCNPGSGADVSRVYSNPDQVTKRWRTWAASVATTIDTELSSDRQPASPIFETVQAIGVRAFGQRMFDNRPKRLVIVSDLLQNVEGKLDMYRELPSFDAFKNTPYYRQVRTDLSDVHVFVLYLNRPFVHTQGTQHVEFWRRYFADQQAHLDSAVQLFGAR